MVSLKNLDLKIGLEIHQQIDGHKLFCKCPCIIKDDEPDYTVKRYLRTSASELGEMDPAAIYELKKGKYFMYQTYSDVNCLVELDENPPEEINKDALHIALQVALLMNAKPVDVVQFMRKIVIDGSNVSGFQRTALIAINGYIETSESMISIPTICLEEEAAKKVEDAEKYRVYNISRMGIPLIEIATGPEIKSPEGAKETAEKIGMVLRSIKGIKRGLGTIRQDINLSIKGHPRVELKGFQDLRSIPRVADHEISRQLELVKQNKEPKSEVRKVEDNYTTTFLRPMPGSDRMYPETDVPLVYLTNELLKEIKLPELIAEKVESLEEKYCLQPELAREVVKREINLENYLQEYRNLDALTIARTIIEVPKEIKARFDLDVDKLKEKQFREILELVNTNKLQKAFILDALVELLRNGIIKSERFATVNDKEIENVIKEIVNKNKGASFNAIMGEAMGKLKGKCDPKKIVEMIKKLTVANLSLLIIPFLNSSTSASS